jgi:hypothetical protein
MSDVSRLRQGFLLRQAFGETRGAEDGGQRSAVRRQRAILSPEKFVELVVRTDPCPLDSIIPPFADHANILAYSHRPIIGVTAELFELKRIVSGIFQKQGKGAPPPFFARHSIPLTPAKSSE